MKARTRAHIPDDNDDNDDDDNSDVSDDNDDDKDDNDDIKTRMATMVTTAIMLYWTRITCSDESSASSIAITCPEYVIHRNMKI